jgi:hypothetical protein
MKHYIFRPSSLVNASIYAKWKALYKRLQRAQGPKHVELWCAIPPGGWNMQGVSIGAPFKRMEVIL